MSGEPRDSLSSQVGYLTSAVESLREDLRDHRAEMRQEFGSFRNELHLHAKDDGTFQRHIVSEVEEVKQVMARQRGFIAGAMLVASTIGGIAGWAIPLLLR